MSLLTNFLQYIDPFSTYGGNIKLGEMSIHYRKPAAVSVPGRYLLVPKFTRGAWCYNASGNNSYHQLLIGQTSCSNYKKNANLVKKNRTCNLTWDTQILTIYPCNLTKRLSHRIFFDQCQGIRRIFTHSSSKWHQTKFSLQNFPKKYSRRETNCQKYFSTSIRLASNAMERLMRPARLLP